MFQFALADVDGIGEATTKRFLEVYGERFTKGVVARVVSAELLLLCRCTELATLSKQVRSRSGPALSRRALAIQAGIPGTVITIDSRTTELCAGTGIKSLPVATALKDDGD
jgi:hypothetical protein